MVWQVWLTFYSFTGWAAQDGVFTYTTDISGSRGPGISQSLCILLLFAGQGGV